MYKRQYHIPDPGLPIFTAMDDLQPVVPGPLPDLVYVQRCAPAELISMLPFHGPGWYAKPAVEYCLHTHKLAWDDLLWGITASAHLKGDQLRGALDIMEQAWADVVVELQINPKVDTPAKRSFNTLVGVFGMTGGIVDIRTMLSYSAQDAPSGWEVLRSVQGKGAFNVPGLLQFNRYTETIDSGSYRHIYDYALCVEHTRIAQAWHAVQAVYKIMRLPCVLLNLSLIHI